MVTRAWSCSTPGCEHKAFGAGTAKSLAFFGWAISDDDSILFCPDHHPNGPESVQALLNSSEFFMRIAVRLDPANPRFEPGLIVDLYNMAGYAEGVVPPPARAD